MSATQSSKVCLGCGVDTPLEEFTAQKNGKFGKTSRCRKCLRAQHAAYRERINPLHLRPKYIKAQLLEKGLKRCTQCDEIKPIAEFHKARRPAGYIPTSTCKKCSREKWSIWEAQNKEHRRKYGKQYREQADHKARGKALRIAQRLKRRAAATPKWVLQITLYYALKRRPATNPMTLDRLMEIYEEQGGRCALSGVVLTWRQGRVLPTSISLDRIDNDIGYAIDNVRLVCHAVNAFRGQMSDDQMLEMAKAIVKHMKKQRKRKAA